MLKSHASLCLSGQKRLKNGLLIVSVSLIIAAFHFHAMAIDQMSAERVGVRHMQAPSLRVSTSCDEKGCSPLFAVPFSSVVPPLSAAVVCAPPLPVLASQGLEQECWYSGQPLEMHPEPSSASGGSSRLQYVSWQSAVSDQVLVLAVTWQGAGDHAAITRQAYNRAICQAHSAGFPVMLRSWNYLPGINRRFGTLDGYQLFCQGREEAARELQKQGLFQQKQYPAATAIGCADNHWQFVWLFVREESFQALENPRQVPAWEYPAIYSPSKPAFSRAVQMGESLLCSGTASVLGHETSHQNDVVKQCEESLKNIQALLEAAHQNDFHHREKPVNPLAAGDGIYRVYLRNAQDRDKIMETLNTQGLKNWVILQGDICRNDLLVECEAVFTRPV